MSAPATDPLSQEAHDRLTKAEQSGLRLAILCRTLLVGAAFVWYVGAALFFPDSSPRTATILVLLAFTTVGIAHIAVIGTRFDRPWIKFAVYALDTLSICASFALVPISPAADVPQIIAFRAYGIYYLFPLLAMTCLSLSWRLVLWTGAMCILGWWGAFFWITLPMQSYFSWADIPAAATRADYEQVFLSINFIGRGNRIEETATLFFAALAMALAVSRARTVFFEQIAAEYTSRQERKARQRVSDLLGKYVPEEIAHRLIEDASPLRPQRSDGTALVLDIEGFTRFSAQHPPEQVIATLDAFLADATRAVQDQNGVVITYLGDGFLATFNAPVAVAHPARAALAAAKQLLSVAEQHGFHARIGLASGPLVTGAIGSETRQSFTVYGDAVNLAARLEAQGKALGAPLLLDEATFHATGAEGQKRAQVQIRGLDTPVALYTPDL